MKTLILILSIISAEQIHETKLPKIKEVNIIAVDECGNSETLKYGKIEYDIKKDSVSVNKRKTRKKLKILR